MKICNNVQLKGDSSLDSKGRKSAQSIDKGLGDKYRGEFKI